MIQTDNLQELIHPQKARANEKREKQEQEQEDDEKKLFSYCQIIC